MPNQKTPTGAGALQKNQTSQTYQKLPPKTSPYRCTWCAYFSEGLRRRKAYLFCRLTGEQIHEFAAACSLFKAVQYE